VGFFGFHQQSSEHDITPRNRGDEFLKCLSFFLSIVLEVIKMMGIFWLTVIGIVWLLGFTLLAEMWFYEEEQELENKEL
jgi:hypothetical protein